VKIKFYTEKAGINANNAKIAFLKYCSMNNSPLMYTIFLAQSLNTKVAYIVQLDRKLNNDDVSQNLNFRI